MKRRGVLLFFALFFVFAALAFGFVNSFTNLYGGYPSFSSKVMKPSKPFGKDDFSISTYRRNVEQYISDAESYVRAANNDISTIEENISKATEEANTIVREYNNYIQFGY